MDYRQPELSTMKDPDMRTFGMVSPFTQRIPTIDPFGNLSQPPVNVTGNRDDYSMMSVLVELNVYITPVIVVVGITGNLLNFLVFATTHLRRQSSSVYLAFLSVADIGFLIAIFVIWLQHSNIPVFHRKGFCQIVIYFTYICRFLSVWLVTSFTVERYIIVCYPFKRSQLCTPRRAKLVVFSLVLFAFLAYSFATWTSGVVVFGLMESCMPLPKYYNLLTVCEIIDMLLTLAIPSLTIAILNVRIVIKIHQFRKQMKNMDLKSSCSNVANTTIYPSERMRPSVVRTSFSTEGTLQFTFRSRHEGQTREGQENTVAQAKVIRLRKDTQYRTAKMLLVVSSVFLILNLPSHVTRLHTFIKQTFGDRYMDGGGVQWAELFHIPYNLNFAINFFLYSACGRPFRRGLKTVYYRFTYRIRKCYSIMRRAKGWDLPKADADIEAPFRERVLQGDAGKD